MEFLKTEHGTFTNNQLTGKSAEEVYQEQISNYDFINGEWVPKQIDICPTPPPTNEELNNQLIETQKLCLSLQKQILLK